MAPIAPGETQLSVQYVLPASASRVTLPFDEAAALVAVYFEEGAARVVGGGLQRSDSTTTIQGRPFTIWSGPLAAGTALELAFPDTGTRSTVLLAALVALLAAALAIVAALRLRGPAPARARAETSPAILLDAVAALDARYAGREAELTGDEWSAYTAQRAELKARLTAALAEREAAR